MQVKRFLLGTMVFMVMAGTAQAQPVPMGYVPDSAGFSAMSPAYNRHKKIIPQFEREILTALSFFPELKDNRVDFVLRKGYAPLSSRPSFGGLFRSAAKRKYKVFVSTGSGKPWDSIILAHAPYDARIGVLGHELSHVHNFSKMSGFSLAWLGIAHVSKKYMNKFEYQTDSLCIAKGMGEYLLAMSTHVRRSFGMQDPEELQVKAERANYRQRYMGPATIRLYMQDHPPYRLPSSGLE